MFSTAGVRNFLHVCFIIASSAVVVKDVNVGGCTSIAQVRRIVGHSKPESVLLVCMLIRSYGWVLRSGTGVMSRLKDKVYTKKVFVQILVWHRHAICYSRHSCVKA